ncbi:MAG: glycerol-3-phosphate 1-O-acyltransferase PlsY [Opitutaceae bacterium]|nr:glycerol-3-phosphate 1-O-acyltransferase PlsY [Opitutaceae bacterium]
MFVAYLIVLAVGYLLGALPFGYLVARAKGVNIFEVGSRNPGATNVRRVLGKGPGNLVFALDALKGAVASAWALLARTEAVFTCEMPEWGLDFMVGGEGWTLLGVAGLVGAMLGHSFSCFTKFKGGKGVATGAGGIFVIIPVSALIAAAVWALVFFAFRYVSLASMVAALSLPLTVWLRDRPPLVVVLTGLIALFVIIRHRENIKRLLNGTENRFVKKSPEEPKA